MMTMEKVCKARIKRRMAKAPLQADSEKYQKGK